VMHSFSFFIAFLSLCFVDCTSLVGSGVVVEFIC